MLYLQHGIALCSHAMLSFSHTHTYTLTPISISICGWNYCPLLTMQFPDDPCFIVLYLVYTLWIISCQPSVQPICSHLLQPQCASMQFLFSQKSLKHF